MLTKSAYRVKYNLVFELAATGQHNMEQRTTYQLHYLRTKSPFSVENDNMDVNTIHTRWEISKTTYEEQTG